MPENPTKTITYTYDDSNWKDKLTSFDGKTITYDAIGNPLSYDGYIFTWEEGRQLARIQGNGLNISYKYNDQGIRTEKTVNGVTTKYYLLGDKVILETNGLDTIHYSYDSSDNLVSMNLNGVEYYYVRNGQGDIIALIDGQGNEVVTYTYDSWGNIISIDGSLATTVGVKNPYRYRGYRYDEETKLYYLQSRFYNPEWGRFINADDVELVKTTIEGFTDKNLFAYTDNNPVNREDSSGFIWFNMLVGAAVGASISIASQLTSGTSFSEINLCDVGGAALSGAIASIPGFGIVGSSIFGGFGNIAGGYISGNIKSSKDLAKHFASGAVANAVGYGVSKHVAKKALTSFNRLPRYARKAKLAKLYSSKGNMRNINIKNAVLDAELGMKLSPLKNFIYSTISSELSGRLTQRILR
ncbi:RHS repeat domain-containing protein [Caloramator sp. Dgby_cultured_2]|uniref:RHS repeat domain-containing protein n=1 Tax=Caloramator sp. Dgby_cultured_2 TaxID=3029174 RepID=UPI00237D4C78|nr:RHS repeat-associated core domain-containing protein [Caloramator sp. Dgby_cultured_2]WDU83820.1 RHS repeat-associated core domain-containing protein [Caloramator sp. Dgby_cultured_2]